MREKAVLALGILFLAGVILRLFRAPLRLVGRVGLNALAGYAALWLGQLSAPLTGFSLGINGVTLLVIGVLGAPGLGLLLLMQWLFV